MGPDLDFSRFSKDRLDFVRIPKKKIRFSRKKKEFPNELEHDPCKKREIERKWDSLQKSPNHKLETNQINPRDLQGGIL